MACLLSNGPGDPEPCDYAIKARAKFMAKKLPLLGICLGHQILASRFRRQDAQDEVRPPRRESSGAGNSPAARH